MKLIVIAIILGMGAYVFSEWNSFVTTIVAWQKELHSMLASHMSAVSEDAVKYSGALIALSFGYGVFHAVGPGHGKAVIVTYLGTSKESLRKGIAISFIAAMLQSVIAIVLVSALAKLLKFKLSEVHNYGNDMALVSYILVILLGIILLFTAVLRIAKLWQSNNNAHHDNDHLLKAHAHHLDHSCGCSHTHVSEEKETIWQTIMVILSMGFRPCSGAIVVLIYAHLVAVYTYGVVATLMMGLGTGLSVSLIAIATLYARTWLERFAISSSLMAFSHPALNHYVRLIGGAVLIALGWRLYSASTTLSSGHPLF